MSLRKHLLLILFFGSLIGLHETFTGGFSMPFRSVVLNSITLILLSLARFNTSAKGSSLAIIAIALMFKLNHAGFQTCTTAWFLCGPTALLSLGVMFEIGASIFAGKGFTYGRVMAVCSFAAIGGFALFGAVSTFGTGDWDIDRFASYIYLKSVMTAIISGSLGMLLLYLSRNPHTIPGSPWRPAVFNGLAGIAILLFWILGTFVS